MRHLYILFLFALLAGCDHDRSFPDTAVPVQIVPSLDHAAPGGTRVIDQEWQSTDVVGVSIDNGTTFKEYKASGTLPNANVTLIPKDAVNTLYYPVNNDEVTFTAFCPYKAPASNIVTYDAFTDQSTSAKMQAVDLIYHYGAKGRKSTATTPVSMSFQHKFSKVVITATRGANVSEDLKNLAMTLTSMPTSAAFNVSTGALGTVSGTGTITPEHYSKGAATTIARAIIAPHAGIANRTITFAVGSLSYSYTIPNTLAFETGKTYAFNFTLTQTAPVLSGSTITAWNGGTIAWDGAGSSLTAPTEVTHYKAATTNNTMVIKTTHANTPGLQFSTSPTNAAAGAPGWLTQVGSLQKTVTGNPNEYTLTYNVDATTVNRACYIHITVGTMTVVTKVNQLFQDPVGLSLTGNITDDIGVGFSGSIEFTSGFVPTLDLSGVSWLTAGYVNISYVSGTTWKLNYTLPANIAGPDPRTGYITVSAGSASQRVNFTQKKQTIVPVTNNNANCFIVAPNAPGILFTLEQIQNAGKQSELTGALSAVVLWKDANCIETPGIIGSGATAVVIVIPTGTQGNALIAIKNASGTIVWSYHIWVSDINLSNTWTINSYKFMDRNLGATAAALSVAGRGLFYQWGRKDPFPATNIALPAGVTGNFPKVENNLGTDESARRNPYIHYYNTSTGDWLQTADNNRWLPASKTVNDPCPAGWRVPANGAWAGLAGQTFTQGDTAGTNWGPNALYPAAGRRDYSNGALSSVGDYGYYWSATYYSSTNAYNLRFNYNGLISPSDSNRKAFGSSVRCVQE